eukprot:TRINITY_DN23630_c0_g1_i8.p1 TRINITY_DN23630_c0_g1~~TRINITY_DN23630_c0_g1_i8.p1  ORF type:complete len:921 (+),score=219.93 TRINITY_DN23630_c0_g1_i8:73-2763(+)
MAAEGPSGGPPGSACAERVAAGFHAVLPHAEAREATATALRGLLRPGGDRERNGSDRSGESIAEEESQVLPQLPPCSEWSVQYHQLHPDGWDPPELARLPPPQVVMRHAVVADHAVWLCAAGPEGPDCHRGSLIRDAAGARLVVGSTPGTPPLAAHLCSYGGHNPAALSWSDGMKWRLTSAGQREAVGPRRAAANESVLVQGAALARRPNWGDIRVLDCSGEPLDPVSLPSGSTVYVSSPSAPPHCAERIRPDERRLYAACVVTHVPPRAEGDPRSAQPVPEYGRRVLIPVAEEPLGPLLVQPPCFADAAGRGAGDAAGRAPSGPSQAVEDCVHECRELHEFLSQRREDTVLGGQAVPVADRCWELGHVLEAVDKEQAARQGADSRLGDSEWAASAVARLQLQVARVLGAWSESCTLRPHRPGEWGGVEPAVPLRSLAPLGWLLQGPKGSRGAACSAPCERGQCGVAILDAGTERQLGSAYWRCGVHYTRPAPQGVEPNCCFWRVTDWLSMVFTLRPVRAGEELLLPPDLDFPAAQRSYDVQPIFRDAQWTGALQLLDFGPQGCRSRPADAKPRRVRVFELLEGWGLGDVSCGWVSEGCLVREWARVSPRPPSPTGEGADAPWRAALTWRVTDSREEAHQVSAVPVGPGHPADAGLCKLDSERLWVLQNASTFGCSDLAAPGCLGQLPERRPGLEELLQRLGDPAPQLDGVRGSQRTQLLRVLRRQRKQLRRRILELSRQRDSGRPKRRSAACAAAAPPSSPARAASEGAAEQPAAAPGSDAGDGSSSEPEGCPLPALLGQYRRQALVLSEQRRQRRWGRRRRAGRKRAPAPGRSRSPPPRGECPSGDSASSSRSGLRPQAADSGPAAAAAAPAAAAAAAAPPPHAVAASPPAAPG